MMTDVLISTTWFLHILLMMLVNLLNVLNSNLGHVLQIAPLKSRSRLE